MENLTKKTYSEFLELKQFKEFLEKLENYINLIEKDNLQNEPDFETRLHLILLQLYAASFQLPELDLKYDSDFENEEFIIRDPKLASKISEQLKNEDYYFDIFDPTDKDDLEPIQFSLLDDIIDIYYELKIAQLKIAKKIPKYIEDGIWDIIFGRNNHWGNHAVNAIRALHYKLYN